MWKTLSEVDIPDILHFVEAAAKDGQLVHIGTDSLQHSKYTSFTSVIAILKPGKGGRVAYKTTTVPRIKSFRERLLRETSISVDIGLQLNELIPGQLTIHLDVNPDARYRSSAHVQELVGYVVGQGFAYRIKPDSWASTSIADWAVRHTSAGRVA